MLIGVGVGVAIRLAGPTDDEARAAVNGLLDRKYKALEARDLDGYMSTIDPARIFLRNCARQRFEAWVRSGEPLPKVSVGRVDKWGKYVRVWLGTKDGWWRSFARYDGGRWYASEPFPGELGDHQTKEYAGVKVHYLAAEEDLASVVGEDLTSIMAGVLPHAAERPSAMFELEIATLSDPGGDCFIGGTAGRWGTTMIKLNDVLLTSTYDHLSHETVGIIEHEALHWLQNEHASRTKMRQRPHWWVSEGWPTLIANNPSLSDRHLATCSSPPSYDDLRLGLRFDAKIEDVANAYTVAAMLVERVAGSSGDVAYWRFFDEFGSTTDPYLRATGSDGRRFYNAWLEEARHLYCRAGPA